MCEDERADDLADRRECEDAEEESDTKPAHLDGERRNVFLNAGEAVADHPVLVSVLAAHP